MAWKDEPRRVVLTVDLTRYHTHLVPGVEGVLVPDEMTTEYGRSPKFGAVRFDCCGHTIDILLRNLRFEGAAAADPKPDGTAGRWED